MTPRDENQPAAVTSSAPAAPSAGDAAAAATTPRPGKAVTAFSLVVALAVAVAGYLWTGAPGGLDAGAENHAEGGEGPDFNAMVERLAQRQQESPDLTGLSMLGRSYMVLGRPADAADAYRRALQLAPDNPDVLANLADAVGVASGHRLDGEPAQLIERALAAAPDHLKALSLAAVAAYQRGDAAVAQRHWERVVAVGPADHPLVQAARETMTRLRDGATGANATAAAPAAVAAQSGAAGRAAAGAGASVAGTVTLAPELAGRVSPQDTVYVFARSAAGPAMPLAILRKQVKDLPIDFVLDDALALSPATKLSSASEVVVGARISKTGNATRQPGDLEGVLAAPVSLGASGLRVTIATEVR
jgi:cytochrome c-type biogenesis protein CcmH